MSPSDCSYSWNIKQPRPCQSITVSVLGESTDLCAYKMLPCSQLSLQQEELEVEEFQLIEKLQQLGINAGRCDRLRLVVHISSFLLQLKYIKGGN